MEQSKVWLVTGASKGLGLELVTQLLAKGYRVAATSRNPQKMEQLSSYKNFLALAMEIDDETSINKGIEAIKEHFGRIDVLVNNAGYGLLGTIEELSTTEIKNVFDVNVFGLINVTKAVLPLMRQQKSGRIINIASISASVAAPTTGIYSATKAVVLQLSESLKQEVEEFGIKVTAICPGGFRTDFLDKSSLSTPKNEIQDYTLVRNVLNRFAELNKNQGGDPKKAPEVFIKVAEMVNPPSRLYLGSDAIRMINKKMHDIQTNIDEFLTISQDTDFD
ncbi:SDR family NAD(P)-dependent oxidoreductase [Chryseobacterium sp.]|uniref:SDR family NAD(P)-dependent oxidoreductase n=1 Tax=Chryseobacterium sp. TaxID=1871047 RepID=UPI00289660C0|nr:SDR family NAD(P)-dependent oxidoreductase [Chryseobacterium sp.]